MTSFNLRSLPLHPENQIIDFTDLKEINLQR